MRMYFGNKDLNLSVHKLLQETDQNLPNIEVKFLQKGQHLL